MIVLRNKNFSSKAQKLLRRKTDFMAGVEAIVKSGQLPKISRARGGKILGMDVIHEGRIANRQNKITNTIHDRVNTNNFLWGKDKNFSESKKGPVFRPGLHIDSRDKNGERVCIPAYIDENGKLKELTEEIWKKYHPEEKKYSDDSKNQNRYSNFTRIWKR